MPNDINYNAIPEHTSLSGKQFIMLNHPKTQKLIKMSLDNFISNLNLSANGGSGNLYIEKTYAEMSTLIASNLLEKGTFYKIIDTADAGIIIQAIETNKLSLQGSGIFLNPDFQDTGVYSGTPSPKGTNFGVWNAADEFATYKNNDIVFWDGYHYQVIDDSVFDGNNPSMNASAYTFLDKTVANVGYIKEVDYIHYDFPSNSIIFRKDRRNNEIYVYDGDFQWGNNNVRDNKDYYNTLYCKNQRGIISYVISNSQNGITFTNEFTASANNCVFGPSSNSVYFKNCGNISSCFLNFPDETINFENSVTYYGKTCISGYSNFTEILDLNNPAIFSANKLTISNSLNYVGILFLENADTKTINSIAAPNLVYHNYKIYPYKGASFTDVSLNIVSTAIALAASDDIVSDVVGTVTLIGRGQGSDFIELKRDGNLNVRTNIVKLA